MDTFLNFIEILKDKPNVYLATLLILSYWIKLSINNWNLADLEKLLLSNFKKFQIALIKSVFVGVVLIVVMYSFSYLFKITLSSKLMIVILVISFFIFMTIKLIVETMSSLLSIKYDYYIVDNNGEPVFRIIKLSGDKFLVESNGIEEFVNPKEYRRYKKIKRKTDGLSKFYNSKKAIYFIILTGALAIGFSVSLYFTSSWVQFVLYMVTVFLVMLFLILLTNFLDNKKEFNNTNNER